MPDILSDTGIRSSFQVLPAREAAVVRAASRQRGHSAHFGRVFAPCVRPAGTQRTVAAKAPPLMRDAVRDGAERVVHIMV